MCVVRCSPLSSCKLNAPRTGGVTRTSHPDRTASDYKLISEQVGLWGAVALLVGTAVGMSIFLVPTQILARAGLSITVAILVSVVPMVFDVLGPLQLGGAIPVAGGAYVDASRLIGPYFGMLGVFIPVLAIWAYRLSTYTGEGSLEERTTSLHSHA